jgi:hypothetical protein
MQTLQQCYKDCHVHHAATVVAAEMHIGYTKTHSNAVSETVVLFLDLSSLSHSIALLSPPSALAL